MNIQDLVKHNSGEITQLFRAYNIKKPVTVETVSAAIAMHAKRNGENPFVDDLSMIVESNYEDWFGGKIIKKVVGTKQTRAAGKERRAEKREARGGSRLGVGLKKIGNVFKKKQADGGQMAMSGPKSELQVAAEQAPDESRSKITVNQVAGAGAAILGGISDTIDNVKNAMGSGGSGGGDMGGDDGGGGSAVEEKTGMKKYLPWILGGLALVTVTIITIVATRKKAA